MRPQRCDSWNKLRSAWVFGGGGMRGTAYLVRLSLSPTEEDWTDGAEEDSSWIPDALRRPFRLARKYGRANRS